MEPTTSFRTFDPMLRTPGEQTAYAEGCRGWLTSPVGLGDQGLVQPEVRGFPKHIATLSPRRMPDALIGILLLKKST